jgi:biofilm PGA synthesis N-glycosyltransferase PgaC
MNTYVLVTPARNEAKVIEKTIASILAQTHRPLKWIIVDDGSADSTSDIIRSYAAIHSFITLLPFGSEHSAQRNFARKVHAFDFGVKAAAHLEYQYLGNLDADILLPPDYYESILYEFAADPRLGIAGGVLFTYAGKRLVCRDTSIDSISGAIQLFRRQCFEAIGGYSPVETGGIDTIAEVTARMKGWTVRKLTSHQAYEQRATGSVGQSSIVARFREGVRCQALGYSTLFFLARCAYKSSSNYLFLLGSIASVAGFAWGKVRRHPVRLPEATVDYLRAEQWNKLRRLLTRGDTSFLIR